MRYCLGRIYFVLFNKEFFGLEIYPYFCLRRFAQWNNTNGKRKIDVRNEYNIVMERINPNCCCGGMGANTRMMNPRAVVSAAMSNAPPVCEMVSQTAFVISPVLSTMNRNRSVTWMA